MPRSIVLIAYIYPRQAKSMLAKPLRSAVLTPMLITLAWVMSNLFYTPAQPHAEPTVDDWLENYYLGAGLGLSFLQPEAESSTLRISQDTDFGYKLLAGYQLDDHWSAELYWADLGQAHLSYASTGSIAGIIGYQSIGISGLYRFAVAETIDGYASAGIGYMNNDVQLLSVEGDNGAAVNVGFGFLVAVAKAWELRAGYDYYTEDAQLLSVTLLKRFAMAPSKPAASSKALVIPEVPPVPELSCEDYSIDFRGVVFAQGSVDLDQSAQRILTERVPQLLKLPADIRFEIRGHADDVGSELLNDRLSLMRARSVRDYLSAYGIPLSRVDAQGYGDWRAKRTDVVAAERGKNRRVELVLIGVEKHVKDTAACAGLPVVAPAL